MTRRLRAGAQCGLGLLMLCAGSVLAQDADPPARAARLSDAEGAVSLQPAGVQEWTAAVLNRPLTSGDRLWSDQNSRAELDLGTAAVRLGSNTGFAFLNLDDRSVQMQLSAGALIVSVRDIQNGEGYEVDTPNIALALQQPGVYRVEVNDQGTATAVSVSQGVAQAIGGGQTVAINSQQAVTFTGTDTLAWQSTTLGAPDEFDDWSAQRERGVAESASAGYVASDIPGTQDLDNNGQWQQAPEYGYVWVPTAVVVGWVPYRYGQWVWVTPWGWTWIDGAPWGYAPFHYGRWIVWNNRWAWVPTPRHGLPGRPVYAPALVAWAGGTVAGGGAIASGGNVGWFPLGPREAYVPPYRVSSTYLRNINAGGAIVTNLAQNNLTPQRYANYTATAVTMVARNTFTSGQRVGGHTVQVQPAVLAAAPVTGAAPSIAPTRQSVLGAAEGRAPARPPAALMQRTVVAHTAPPPAPVPFERQLSAIAANGGRPPAPAELELLQHGAALTPVKLVGTRAGPARAPAAGRAPSANSLGERERALQQSVLPSAPRVNVPARPPANTSAYVLPGEPLNPAAPVLRSDRPPSAAQHPAEAAPRAVVPASSPPAVEASSALPVYQFPAGAEGAPAHPATNGHPQQTNRVPPPPSVPHAATPLPPPPPAHAPPATHPQSSTEPRESAPHGDRDSRERVLR